jgi:CheY-like chemotaxis protein
MAREQLSHSLFPVDPEPPFKRLAWRVRQIRESIRQVTQYLGPIDAYPSHAYCRWVECRLKRNSTHRLVVAVVDDDESVRESLPDLLGEFGFSPRAYSSAEEFLTSDSVGQTKCLIVDIAMPRMNGLALQRELKARALDIPIVFVTANKDEAVRAQALQGGAVAVLLKPFGDTALLDALNAAIQSH